MHSNGKEKQNQNLSGRFADLLKGELAKRKEEPLVFKVLRENADAIREARELKIPFGRIAELLKAAGIEAGTEDVRAFCRTVLEEKAPKRRRKRRKLEAKPTPLSPSPQAAIQRPSPAAARPLGAASSSSRPQAAAKPGFRVARDEEL